MHLHVFFLYTETCFTPSRNLEKPDIYGFVGLLLNIHLNNKQTTTHVLDV